MLFYYMTMYMYIIMTEFKLFFKAFTPAVTVHLNVCVDMGNLIEANVLETFFFV